MGGIGGGGQRVCWPPSQIIRGPPLSPPPTPRLLFLRLCSGSVTIYLNPLSAKRQMMKFSFAYISLTTGFHLSFLFLFYFITSCCGTIEQVRATEGGVKNLKL